MLNPCWRVKSAAVVIASGALSAPCLATPPEPVATNGTVATTVAAPSRTTVPGQVAMPPRIVTLSFQTSHMPAPSIVPYAGTARIAEQEVAPDRAGYLAWFDGKAQLRSDRTRLDFYPIQGSGVHVSGGSRLHMGYQTAGSTIALDNRDAIKMDPRRQAGPTALSTGYDRYAPMALVGYTEKVGDRMTVAIDAGAMRGRAVAVDAFSVVGSETLGATDGGVYRMNPVVDMTLNFAF